jgi:CNT family concentrative nucleoside transporter
MSYQLQSLLGLAVLPMIAWALSERRDALRLADMARLVAIGAAIQLTVAGLLLNVPVLRDAFQHPAIALEALQTATNAGVRLVFGYLAGGPPPFEAKRPENGFVLALQVLPLVLLISVLSKLLFHWGLLQIIVRGFAFALERTMGVKGAVGTAAAANVFLGMVEAPLIVKPYLATMSRAGLFATMTVGMAGVAGTVLAVYAELMKAGVPGAAGHLIVASVISVPAGLVIAALMVPEVREPEPAGGPGNPAAIAPPADSVALTEAAGDRPQSTMDAITEGTREGLELLVNITSMLIVAVALVTLVNIMLAALFAPLGLDVRMERLLGFAFAPLAFLIGIPWPECATAGSLLGVKTILNEFIAYAQLSAMPAADLTPRSRLLMTYALCGFANLGSLGIMIGGLVAMAPRRRAEILELGPRTVIAGTLATLMTAAVVGVLTPGG